jgi:preprotein translocase subunit SecG
MAIIGIVLLVIMAISAVLLVLVVLVQDDQGEGIGGIFGGGSNTAFGSRSGNVLTRFTAVLAAIFLISVFGMAWINRTPAAGNVLSKARQEALAGGSNSWWVQAPAATPAPGSTAPLSGANPLSASPASTTTPVSTTPTTPAPAKGGSAPASTTAPAGGQ